MSRSSGRRTMAGSLRSNAPYPPFVMVRGRVRARVRARARARIGDRDRARVGDKVRDTGLVVRTQG